MINGILIVFLQDFIGKLLKIKHIILGVIIYSISYFAVAFVTNLIFAIIDVIFITIAEMIVSPISQAIASSLTKDEHRGRELGIYGMVTALGRVIGSSYSSYLMSYFLYSPLYLWSLISILGIMSIPLYLLNFKRIETNG